MIEVRSRGGITLYLSPSFFMAPPPTTSILMATLLMFVATPMTVNGLLPLRPATMAVAAGSRATKLHHHQHHQPQQQQQQQQQQRGAVAAAAVGFDCLSHHLKTDNKRVSAAAAATALQIKGGGSGDGGGRVSTALATALGGAWLGCFLFGYHMGVIKS